MIKKSELMTLSEKLGPERVRANFVLAPYTTFKIGGPAEYFYEAYKKEDIVSSFNVARGAGLKFTILGGASNVVVSDRGIRGLVVRNLYSQKRIVKETKRWTDLEVSSGYPISKLVRDTVELGLAGFEYHLGLPGTLGGALYMNSKWTRPTSYMGDSLVKAEILTVLGEIKIVPREYFKFGYDQSIIQETKEIVLTATFHLEKKDKKILENSAKQALEYRKRTQPYGVSSSGCFFRNVNGASAGQLIDRLGLAGFSKGQVAVSDKHANFLLNKGGAKMGEVRELVEMIKQKVAQKYGVNLREEVIFLD